MRAFFFLGCQTEDISSVLPELGEENVEQTTFDDIASSQFDGRFQLESRSRMLEALTLERNPEESGLKRQSTEFKASRVFVEILRRLIRHYERQLIPVEDVYYDGKILATRQQLKNLLLNNKIGMPLAKRLKRIETMLADKIHPLQKRRLEKIESIVAKSEGHEFDVKPFSRLLSIKEVRGFLERLRKFTTIDYFHLYKLLFNDYKLFFKLAKGFGLPGNIDRIMEETKKRLELGKVNYDDCAPLLYLKLSIEGSNLFSEIKQVVVDEAQDYYPLQYEVFKLLFKDAGFTVLGDIHQTIEKDADQSFYDVVAGILDKRKTVRLFLNKSYRSSYEINRFTQKLLSAKQDFISFQRYEEEPLVVYKDSLELLDRAIAHDIADFLGQGYGSVAVICKTLEEAEIVHTKLSKTANIKLMNANEGEIEQGAMVIPAYMAKGLEFDVVIVYGVSKENYSNEYDRKLLYIACSRALHRLALYYTGEKSPLI